MATDHLIKTGYKSIGYVHVGKGNLLSEVRKNGYSRALIENDMPYIADLIYYLEEEPVDAGADRYTLGTQFASRFAGLPKRPEALFFYNDMVALGFIQAAAEFGIQVPRDVAIVGFDDVLVARYASVPLTTIHQPVDRIGKWAVDVINSRLTHQDIGNRITLKPQLIVRESCGARKRGLLTPGAQASGSSPEA